jgi:hypothetical protein
MLYHPGVLISLFRMISGVADAAEVDREISAIVIEMSLVMTKRLRL